MAFDFLGTIPSFEAFEEFEEFVQLESKKLDKRIDNLVSERKRHLELLDKFLQADVNMRAEYKKSLRPDRLWLASPRTRTNTGVDTLDAVNAVDVSALKDAFKDSIKVKRENNEFKVKRLRDLADQISDEIKMLGDMKESYKDYLNKIRARFDLQDFPENQRNKEQDQAEIQPGLTAVPVDQGIVVEDGKTYYLALGMSSQFKTIYFDGQNPPVKKGDILIISGGKNAGSKTVMSIKSDRAVEVYEDLVDESNSDAKIEIKA